MITDLIFTLHPYKALNILHIMVGIRVSKWPLSDGGLFLDREWALVSGRTGKVLTQKSHPKLATCKPSLRIAGSEASDAICSSGLGRDSFIVFRAPGMEKILAVDINAPSSTGERISAGDSDKKSSVLVCNQQRMVLNKSSEVYSLPIASSVGEVFTMDGDAWFSDFIGEAVSVVRRSRQRTLNVDRSNGIDSESSVANFSNEAEFLMITEWSLSHLASVRLLSFI